MAIAFDEADEAKKSVAIPYEIGDADDFFLGVSYHEDRYPETLYDDINLLIVPEQAYANNKVSSSDTELISAFEEGRWSCFSLLRGATFDDIVIFLLRML